MKATELLKSQHEEVSRLFKAIESAKGKPEKKKLFNQLAANLVAHDGIEREIFYPACEEAMGLNDLLGEALVEHGFIEFGLYQATEAMDDDDFDFKVKVLGEIVEHHVEEEEEEFFPKAEKALGNDSLELLGDEMSEAFEEALTEDFRGPLYNNLQQVFAGALKTSPVDEEDEEDDEDEDEDDDDTEASDDSDDTDSKDSQPRVAKSQPAPKAKPAAKAKPGPKGKSRKSA